MAENLKVTHYRNGDEIPTGYIGNDWGSLNTGAYASYPADNDDASQNTCEGDCSEIYGNLYNWYAVDDDRGVCPEGWHVPTDEEWMELEMSLGMSYEEAHDTGYRGTNEGSQLAGNADLWDDGDLENNGEFGTSGLMALPGGYRGFTNGYYYSMGDHGFLWSSTANDSSNAWHRNLYYTNSDVYRYTAHKRTGFSVRCVGD